MHALHSALYNMFLIRVKSQCLNELELHHIFHFPSVMFKACGKVQITKCRHQELSHMAAYQIRADSCQDTHADQTIH